MNFDPSNKSAQNFVGQESMLLRQHNTSAETGFGAEDSIGRTFLGYFTYEWKWFVRAVKNCFEFLPDGKVQSYRHPALTRGSDKGMSRDHFIYALCLFKLAGEEDFINSILRGSSWRISKDHTHTIDSWLWVHAVSGRKLHLWLWYTITLLLSLFYVGWNKTLNLLGGFKELSQEDFQAQFPTPLSNRDRFLAKLRYPSYALFILSWQLWVLEDCWIKQIIKFILAFDAGKENLVLRMLLGKKISLKKARAYKPMTDLRWSAQLDKANTRFMQIIDEKVDAYEERLSANLLDRDLLSRLYSITQR